MKNNLNTLRFPTPELKVVMNMDWPPPPPSPFDEIGHNKRRVQVRQRILRVMKEKYPGLPY